MISLLKADVLKVFPISTSSVDLVVTSPPYWRLKDYMTSTQLGWNDTFEGYLYKMSTVFKECKRVLQPTGFMCVVASDLKSIEEPYFITPINAYFIVILSRMMVYEGTIIWRKTARNGTVVDPIMPPKIRYNREEIHIFRKRNTRKVLKGTADRNITKGWIHTPNPKQTVHPATYPINIPLQLIKMYSEQGDIVLDPFVGTGTTLEACRVLDRNGIGMDINDKYLNITSERLTVDIEYPTQVDYPNDEYRGKLKII